MAATLEQYRAAEELERELGDPLDPENALSFRRSVELDETERYPEAACRKLRDLRIERYYVPAGLGGRLESYEELLGLVQVLSRRDLSVAISDAHTFLGAVPVWIGGTAEQQRHLAEFILGGGSACLALTERAHGSDLLSTETRAVSTPTGYALSGEKWPINKATMTQAVTVLARTDTGAGERALSLFLLEKNGLPAGTLEHLPKVKTLGIRACDISGLRLNAAPLSRESRIGAEGQGFELTLKGFQVTRTLAAGLSLGAVDTALRTTLAFARSRQLYDRPVASLPQPRRALVDAFLDVLIAQCVAITGARALHAATAQASLLSAIVKYFVPVTLERTIHDLSVVLGARHYLREEHVWGVFQKVLRDAAIISLFDGSTVINLHVIALHLPHLARRLFRKSPQALDALRPRLRRWFALHEPLPPAELDRLSPFSFQGDDVLQGLPATLEDLRALPAEAVDPDVRDAVIRQLTELIERARALASAARGIPLDAGHHAPPEMFALAREYCVIHAAAACVQLWLYHVRESDDDVGRGAWLALCLGRLLARINATEVAVQQSWVEGAAERLAELHDANRAFSIAPFRLAGPAGGAGASR